MSILQKYQATRPIDHFCAGTDLVLFPLPWDGLPDDEDASFAHPIRNSLGHFPTVVLDAVQGRDRDNVISTLSHFLQLPLQSFLHSTKQLRQVLRSQFFLGDLKEKGCPWVCQLVSRHRQMLLGQTQMSHSGLSRMFGEKENKECKFTQNSPLPHLRETCFVSFCRSVLVILNRVCCLDCLLRNSGTVWPENRRRFHFD